MEHTSLGNQVIIEIANTHGGDINYITELIGQFEKFKDFGIKFQPLHPDKLATPNFAGYPIYQELLFKPEEWSALISIANTSKNVWLDIFDEYGVQILKENYNAVYGIKLQVSVLFNAAVIKELSTLNLSGKKLILNIAALELHEIEYFLKKFESDLNPSEIFLEVGFQGYPTQLLDSGISKIQTIKENFGKKIVFADHIDRESKYAIWMPAMAMASGADIIEKHVLLDSRETKYDKYSSLDIAQFEEMIEIIINFSELNEAGFINERERNYLKNSIMKPILKSDKMKGQLLSVSDDFHYKRSGLNGLNSKEISDRIANFHILSVNKKEGDTLLATDFKKANIALISACRLKSSRLKEKALLNIGDLTSVEFSLKNACRFTNVNHVILATSTLDSDSPLENHTYSDSVIFHRGDPDDVIQRYLDITRVLKIDVVIRVTADNPYLDEEICQILLKSHFESGADYTTGAKGCIGTNFEIISVQALETIKNHFPNADYSEYMTWYFMNNKAHFKINLVDLPEIYVRDYRLTLDYEDDLTLFNQIHEKLAHIPDYTLKDVITLLDSDPELVKINQHINPAYMVDQKLIDTLNEKTKIKSL
jgi:spore coat polysaccharide biosynthesis protein SpsF (cytidylyltransferase family)/sialic acid synthase SpsE